MEANMSVKEDDIITEEKVDEISINENQRAQTIFNKDINVSSESEAQYCCALEYGFRKIDAIWKTSCNEKFDELQHAKK